TPDEVQRAVVHVDSKMGGTISALIFQVPASNFRVQVTPADGEKLIWLKTGVPALWLDLGAPITILFSHASADSLKGIQRRNTMHVLAKKLDANILAYEYTGYGISQHGAKHLETTEASTFADAEAAFTKLSEDIKIPSQEIILFGRSLGAPRDAYLGRTGPTLHLADKLSQEGVQLGGVILEGAFLSLREVVTSFGVPLPPISMLDMFRNVDRIGGVTCPVLCIHGTRDEVVPIEQAYQLLSKVKPEWRAKSMFIDGGGHNNLSALLQGLYYAGIASFLHSWAWVRQIKEEAPTSPKPNAISALTSPTSGTAPPVSSTPATPSLTDPASVPNLSPPPTPAPSAPHAAHALSSIAFPLDHNPAPAPPTGQSSNSPPPGKVLSDGVGN
ncbi:unnamed protein product, partial [Discosporangium mesarthrocarpum]